MRRDDTLLRGAFLAAETAVAGVFGWGFLSGIGWVPDIPDPETPIGYVAYGAIMVVWLLLLVGSPFFLPRLGRLALAGWAIAVSILLIGMLFPAL